MIRFWQFSVISGKLICLLSICVESILWMPPDLDTKTVGSRVRSCVEL